MQDTIVLYPSPGMGHLLCTVELGKLIFHRCNQELTIKILLIAADPRQENPNINSYLDNTSRSHPFISFHPLPPAPLDTTPTRSGIAMYFDWIRLHSPQVLDSLKEISRTSNIKALVIDLFCSSALPIGKELKIPTYYFFTSGAACLGAFLYFPRIHEQHTKSLKNLPNTLIHFPGLPPAKAIHMPEPLLDRDDPAYNDFLYYCSHLAESDGIVVNTFEDLEPKAVKNLADGLYVPNSPTPPIFYVGPVIVGDGSSDQSRGANECLSWLDEQPSKSVVFLCFGSRGSFSKAQVREMAVGLEGSGQRFLWVVKNPPVDGSKNQTADLGDFDLDAILPDGFLERVKDRGLVIKSWAPQLAVLSHDSVGGFVTHCGWNSVLEAVLAGVPMVAWPLYAEQHLNRNVLVEEMKMAIAVQQRDEDGFVSGDELERRVRELMDSDKGRELKELSGEMKQMALGARTETGSSTRALDQLVKVWMGSNVEN